MTPWAKLARACGKGLGPRCRERCGCPVTHRLSLVGHSADVAAVTAALLEQRVIVARLAALLGLPALGPGDRARIVALAALHDLGKVNLGFQDAPFAGRTLRAGHVAPVLALLGSAGVEDQGILERLRSDGGLAEVAHLIQNGGNHVPLKTALAHHGRLPEPGRSYPAWWRARDGYDPVLACRALVEAIRLWVPATFAPMPTAPGPIAWTPPFGHAFAGLLTLADWLGSDAAVFRFDGSVPDGPERFAWALPVARDLLAARGLAPAAARARALHCAWDAQVLTGHADPRPAQLAMLGLPPAPPSGRLCVIEDETGAGKTEAALVHFLDLFRQGLVDGMYFALPTRAAARQIHRRIEAALQRLLGADAPPVILAVPGYADRTRPPLPDPGALHPDGPEDLRYDSAWSAETPKRFLASWVAVGTIDQALLGGLLVRHAQLRSAALLRLLLVVDEVHASDVYMTAILRNLLVQHRRAGGHALLMSATLGSAARARFLTLSGRSSPTSLAEAVAAPYPALWADGGAPPLHLTGPTRPERSVRVRLDAAWDQPDAIAALAVAAARAGAQVLVIRNAVALVVSTQRALERLAPELSLALEGQDGRPVPCPHHARFAPEDRERLDAALEARLGKASLRTAGSVTIASQTAEQSLDIDADLLITDLCPADVLLQRIGRLHRHRREAPRPAGFDQPCAVVLAPPEEALAASICKDGAVQRGPLALGLVYPDLLGVLATRRALEAHPVLQIPCDNRRLVEAATHGPTLERLATDLGGRWPAHGQHLAGVRAAFVGQANLNAVTWTAPIESLPELGEKVRTRLGLDDRIVALPQGTRGPFGTLVSSLSVRGHWLAGVPHDAQPVVAPGPDGALLVRLGDRMFRYDRHGLRPDAS